TLAQHAVADSRRSRWSLLVSHWKTKWPWCQVARREKGVYTSYPQNDLEQEAAGVRQQMAQVPGARALIKRMGQYYVASHIHDYRDCQAAKGMWVEGANACRFSAMLSPFGLKPA